VFIDAKFDILSVFMSGYLDTCYMEHIHRVCVSNREPQVKYCITSQSIV